MQLEGSCHCQSVRFRVESSTPYPYQLCYCSICRKTQGGGGFAINLSAKAQSLKIDGKENIQIYRAMIKNPEDDKSTKSTGERNFCKQCGSALWLFSPEYPELVHPFASAIDSELPGAPEQTHIMLEFKMEWVQKPEQTNDQNFKRYSEESIKDWHERLGLTK